MPGGTSIAAICPGARAPGETPDPYRVWLSEILLQQTTATTAAPYFQKFVARWPRVEALAAASLDEVMAAFSGLGYYRRARNLHACAREVARRGGRFPPSEADLRALPGVGAYTAAAVAAIAYGAKAAPVDGNVARILARLYALEAPIAQARRAIGEAAAALTPADRPGDFAAGADGPRRADLPAAPSRLPRLSAAQDLRGGARRRARGLSPPRSRQAQAGPRRRGVFRAARGRRDPRAAAPARRAARRDARIAGRAVGGGRARATSSLGQAPFAASWRRLPGEVEQAFTHFTLRLTLYAAEVGVEAAERPKA